MTMQLARCLDGAACLLLRAYRWAVIPLRVEAFRLLDRLLPVAVLYWLQVPLVTVPHALTQRLLAPLWGRTGLLGGFIRRRNFPAGFFLNNRLEYIRDRAQAPRWLGRCRLVGRHHLEEANRAGRPAILAFCHFGPYVLTGSWLRAHGLPVVTLSAGTRQTRPRLRHYMDRYEALLGLPEALYLDEMRAVVRHIAGGGNLLIAVDNGNAPGVDVPLGDGRSLHMATGAARLAARHGADLIPCGIVDEGRWRFRVELGRPVPAALLGPAPDFAAIGAHIYGQLAHHWQDRPEQCDPGLAGHLRLPTPRPEPRPRPDFGRRHLAALWS